MKFDNTTPLRDAELFFGSNKKTAEQTEPEMPPYDIPVNSHRSIMIIPNFVSPEDCKFLVEYANERTTSDLSVFDSEKANKGTEDKYSVKKETRNTQLVECDDRMQETLTELIKQAVEHAVNPYFGINLATAESVQFLKYGIGGHYKPHPDGEGLWLEKEKNQLVWKKNVDRDISILIYLNSEYEGGQLIFPEQHITLNPKPGMLVAFPSSHHFIHGVTPITSGTRYALVTWASLGNWNE